MAEVGTGWFLKFYVQFFRGTVEPNPYIVGMLDRWKDENGSQGFRLNDSFNLFTSILS